MYPLHHLKWLLKIVLIPLALTVSQHSFSNVDHSNKNANNNSVPNRPNIIIIFADDLGYGDLGLFGSEEILTPNIDRLGTEGIKFTEFYAASPICSPSRAALLTGRYPFRQGINHVFFHESMTGMAPEEVTIAELLKSVNYRSALIGKWHLGHMDRYMPWNQGFDYYFGVPYSNDMANLFYYRNKEIIREEIDQRYLTQNYTSEAISFIRRNAESPFFLYLAHNMPHTPIYASPEFEGKSKGGLYGDVVEEMDWSVGEIMKTLKELQLEENTLVVFTSDNGPWLLMGKDGGSPGILREGKTTTFEGGMRVPAVAYWKGVIPPSSQYNNMATMMDWLPTIAEITGIPIASDKPIDGKTILPVLLGTGEREDNQFLYHSHGLLDSSSNGQFEAYRSGDWKIKKAQSSFLDNFLSWFHPGFVANHGDMLINLKLDPAEKNNLIQENPEQYELLINEMEAYIQRLGELPDTLPVLVVGADYSAFYKFGATIALKIAGAGLLVLVVILMITRKVRARRRAENLG